VWGGCRQVVKSSAQAEPPTRRSRLRQSRTRKFRWISGHSKSSLTNPLQYILLTFCRCLHRMHLWTDFFSLCILIVRVKILLDTLPHFKTSLFTFVPSHFCNTCILLSSLPQILGVCNRQVHAVLAGNWTRVQGPTTEVPLTHTFPVHISCAGKEADSQHSANSVVAASHDWCSTDIDNFNLQFNLSDKCDNDIFA